MIFQVDGAVQRKCQFFQYVKMSVKNKHIKTSCLTWRESAINA